jgi:hypothetical protein
MKPSESRKLVLTGRRWLCILVSHSLAFLSSPIEEESALGTVVFTIRMPPSGCGTAALIISPSGVEMVSARLWPSKALRTEGVGSCGRTRRRYTL